MLGILFEKIEVGGQDLSSLTGFTENTEIILFNGRDID